MQEKKCSRVYIINCSLNDKTPVMLCYTLLMHFSQFLFYLLMIQCDFNSFSLHHIFIHYYDKLQVK